MALRARAHPTRDIALFAGGGGLSLGLKLAVPSLRTVCHVEREAFAAAVLVARMEEAFMDPSPVWDDVSTFDGRPWRGVVDCISGGFPCQDISNAGQRAGIDGERSGLWREFARIISEAQPRFVYVENVAALVNRGLDRVLGDLAAMGFDAEWGVFRASEAGAPHRRERVFILAHAERLDIRDESGRGGWPRGSGESEPRHAGEDLADADERGCESERSSELLDREWAPCGHDADGCRIAELADAACVGRLERRTESEGQQGRLGASVSGGAVGNADVSRLEGRVLLGRSGAGERAPWTTGGDGVGEWPPGPDDSEGWRAVLAIRPDLEPAVRRMADGMAAGLVESGPLVYRAERLRLLGNGVVPAQAALAYRVLHSRLFGTDRD